jgi:ABC-type antimicrobial peptide transport system permease subunit
MSLIWSIAWGIVLGLIIFIIIAWLIGALLFLLFGPSMSNWANNTIQGATNQFGFSRPM